MKPLKNESHLVDKIDRLTLLTEDQEALDLLDSAREACERGEFGNARSLIIRAEEELET